MSMRRYGGSAFADVTVKRRFNGNSWVNLTFGRRWNGSAWVNLGNDAGGSGTLVDSISSTVSRPTVHYAVMYTAAKSDGALTVTLTFGTWLNSAASSLGTGVKLTVFARLNGGTWRSAIIKPVSESWSGTSRHTANLTLTGSSGGSSATVEFYVTRSGSTYGGTAGTLGSAANPKKYTISMN